MCRGLTFFIAFKVWTRDRERSRPLSASELQNWPLCALCHAPHLQEGSLLSLKMKEKNKRVGVFQTLSPQQALDFRGRCD